MTRTAGALSAGMLIKDLGKHIHPEGRKKLIAGGLFDKLAKIINVANTAYSVVNKAIPIVTKGVSTYKSFKTAYDGMKKGGDLDTSGAVTGDMVIMAKPKRRGGKLKGSALSAGVLEGAKLTAGAMPTGGAVKKRTLPPALRERAKRMGELMREKKMSMAEASAQYKEEQKNK